MAYFVVKQTGKFSIFDQNNDLTLYGNNVKSI